MTITLTFTADIEQRLLAKAQAQGVSVADYVEQLVAREARPEAPAPEKRTGQALIDACARVRGLLTDEEIDSLFSRNRLPSRSVDLA